MTKTQYRDAIRALLKEDVAGLTLDEKASIMEKILIQQQDEEIDCSNKNKSWTDEELRLVLQHAPTESNSILLARAFRRSRGSIEMIYRWAATPSADIEAKRGGDSYLLQIKQVAKRMGWRGTGPSQVSSADAE
jgi:hypothetical protein